VAAGFLVYRRRASDIEYLLLRASNHGEWGPPKGHADAGESELETAWRETEEESGLVRDDLARNAWFEDTVRYTVNGRPKRVVYYLAECSGAEPRLSHEHTEARWASLADAISLVVHDNLRELFTDGAVFLKDPALHTGLDPAGARDLLEEHCGADAPVVAHTALVAGVARAIAEAWGDVDAAFVESAAWLHDIGRAVDHGPRHPLEGFRLLARLGHPGYAPCCLSHYTKGRQRDEMTGDAALLDEMWRCCDLSTFSPEERIVALADFMAVGEKKGTIDERHADLVARYGASAFLDGSRAAATRIRAEFEERTGLDLYRVAGIAE
jgi:bis(5'-nucleosidyl)-tetraphosphatase